MTDSPRAQHIPTHTPTPKEFLEVSQSPEFASLKTTFRSFAFPMTIAFLAWYLGYIVTATYATSFVQRPVFGVITVGMVLGLAQFVTAGLITWAYVRFADNKLDPAAEAIRTMMENPKDA